MKIRIVGPVLCSGLLGLAAITNSFAAKANTFISPPGAAVKQQQHTNINANQHSRMNTHPRKSTKR